MKCNAYAKINLSLDITGRRDDGYHDIKSVMQSVSLCDIVSVEQNDTGKIEILSNSKDIPLNENNIAYKAAMRMKEEYKINCGFDIFIEKNIPVAGGMAGGSTNAAAVIRLINEVCDLNLSEKSLKDVGVKIGADVPFCIGQTACLAEGIGEVLTPILALDEKLWILIVNPKEKISTKMIYDEIDKNVAYNTVDTESLILSLCSRDLHSATKNMVNVMQTVSEKHCTAIADITEKIKSLGAVHAMMSGSGATCFGIFEKKPDILEAQKLFEGYFVCLAHPLK